MQDKKIYRTFLRFDDVKGAELVSYIMGKINERTPATYIDTTFYPVDDKEYVVGIFMGFESGEETGSLTGSVDSAADSVLSAADSVFSAAVFVTLRISTVL